MATANPYPGPQIAPRTQGGVALPLSPAKIQAKFDLAIALTLASWPALSLAVQNSWGGPQSSEKREWFAGAISDLMAATPDADVDYVEEFLLQVMNDEFEVNVEDDSAEKIAAKIVGLRKLTLMGDVATVDEMYREWQEKQRTGGGREQFQEVVREEGDDDTDWDSEDEDIDMQEPPQLVKAQKEKAAPEVDEDGFTKVIGKKKR
ncbi:hypothetical protein MMC20_007133 [Loxospora ochrophaea]|nr:hypothetical protein [Loxospora ochrophaea]